MDFIAYQQTFLNILNSLSPLAPYNSPDYLNYVKLNMARQQRWLKAGILNKQLADIVKGIREEQFWHIITEPWCGDAAHTLPFIHKITELNSLIKVDYQLRDTAPFLINSYLTNGSKSIPKLIIADKNNQNLAVWGPRPAACQLIYNQLLHDHVDYEQKKIVLQKWYNEDKGKSFQMELLSIMIKLLPV